MTIVTGLWGFVEAYTYFQGDSLKNAIGSYWIGIYLIPLPVALLVGILRTRTKRDQSANISVETRQITREKATADTGKYSKYKGLLWERKRFDFRLPTPLCPHNGCMRPVSHKREYPPRYLVSSNPREMQEFLNKQNTYKNAYHCPVHGELRDVPDIDLEALRREARFELKR